jgi:hypothetical protein
MMVVGKVCVEGFAACGRSRDFFFFLNGVGVLEVRTLVDDVLSLGCLAFICFYSYFCGGTPGLTYVRQALR